VVLSEEYGQGVVFKGEIPEVTFLGGSGIGQVGYEADDIGSGEVGVERADGGQAMLVVEVGGEAGNERGCG
jgi:hypothetical protein